MFDVGFSELLVIAVVALLVLGPERLPKAARFAGLWVRRARAQWNSVKAEFEALVAERVKRIRIGKPSDPQTNFGPLASAAQLDKTIRTRYDRLRRPPAAQEAYRGAA